MNYKKDIVDPNDMASKLAREVCVRSFSNSPAVTILDGGGFRGRSGFRWRKGILEAMIREEMEEVLQNDGAGGKPQFFSFMGTKEVFAGLGWEIITMCADDIVRFGDFPVIMVNQVDVKTITPRNFHLFKAIMKGYGEALKSSGLVNITGETAVMKHSITAFCDDKDSSQLMLTWSGACLGLGHKDKKIDGSKIEPGMPIVGLHEKGYRCNGGTFFTKLLTAKFGSSVGRLLRSADARNFVKKLTVPSVSYAKLISSVHGWRDNGSRRPAQAEMLGIAHITGGGVWSKLSEALPDGIGARLNSMPKPPAVLWKAQEMSLGTEMELSDYAAYGTFHGGCGMMIVCAKLEDARTLCREADYHGVGSSLVGITTSSDKKEIVIASKFGKGGMLSSLQS